MTLLKRESNSVCYLMCNVLSVIPMFVSKMNDLLSYVTQHIATSYRAGASTIHYNNKWVIAIANVTVVINPKFVIQT